MPSNVSSPANPVKVVHLAASLGNGGAEKQLYLLISNSSAPYQHQVLTVVSEGRWAGELRALGVEVECLKAHRVVSLMALVRLVLFLRRMRPDVLHCWLPSMNIFGAIAVWLSRLSMIQVVATVRNVDDWKPGWRKALDRLVSRFWAIVICNSQAGLVQSGKDGIAREKLTVVVNGIEPPPAKLNREAARLAMKIPCEAILVVCASRLVEQKRLRLVLDAARQLPELSFLIAGHGPLFEELRRHAPQNVRLLGHLPDTGQLFAAADIFLSVSEREGTSNSLLEALQAGCAAVVTDAGDNLSLAGSAGLAVKPDQISTTLSALASDTDRLARMRADAPRRAQCFSTAAMVASTEAVYDRISARAKRSTRVLFLDYTNGIGMGGGQRSLLLLLADLDRSQFEPVLACPRDEVWRSLVPVDVRQYDLSIPESFRRLTRSSATWATGLRGMVSALGSVWHLRQLMKSQAIDLVHANNLKMLLVGAAAGWGRRIPILWHVRDILPERPAARWARGIAARLSTRVIAVSSAVASQFTCSTELVHNAVRLPLLDSAPSDRTSFRRNYGIPAAAFVFGYVGRLDSGKGIDILLRAFAQASLPSETYLLITGDGEMGQQLKQLAESLSITRIAWTGFKAVPGEAFAALDCAVVPSVEPDSFPRAVIEAMSWALPVIGSTSGGIGEAIVDYETGSIVAAGDISALAAAMAHLASRPEVARQWGARGRKLCEQRFTVSSQMERIEGLYREVLQGTR